MNSRSVISAAVALFAAVIPAAASISEVVVPEPGTIALVGGAAIVGIAVLRRRRGK